MTHIDDIRRVCAPVEQERRRKRGEQLAGKLLLLGIIAGYLYYWHSAWVELSK